MRRVRRVSLKDSSDEAHLQRSVGCERIIDTPATADSIDLRAEEFDGLGPFLRFRRIGSVPNS
jgi:hypothetical protein